MPTLFCCILNCESESVNIKKRKIFYRLPQNSDRKQLWMNQIGDRIKYGTLSSNSRICNLHFATGKPNLDSSHIDYMPTIFPWSSKEEKMKSYKSVEEYESKIKELEQKILAKAFLNASSGSKLSQESSTTKFELIENDTCSKLINDSNLTNDLNKYRAQKPLTKSPIIVSEVNRSDKKSNIISNSLEGKIACEPVKVPVFKESITNTNTNQANIQSSINTSSTLQLTPDNTLSIKSNFLHYLLSSLAQVNMVNNTQSSNCSNIHNNNINGNSSNNNNNNYNNNNNNQINNNHNNDSSNNSDLVKSIVNVSMATLPINLSQNFNLDNQTVKKEKINEIDRTTTPSEETTCHSCTCTKSSCLKLYCECFANGNLCCSGCTCINCRNNDNFKEERTKIVNSYLERDPWVFNSKIENKDVGKKHSKGCNCLKSSCLKNYCECFENKVFCSSLCRCRMCYNNEDHTQHNNKDETKIYASSHTSESLSVMSENSPRLISRKRKQSALKTSEIYEDVSSNIIAQESEEENNSKRCQLEPEKITVENDKQVSRSINSMEIPPVLPQEDDFTEEELALMLKFREQRSEKPGSIKMECVSPPLQSHQSTMNINSGGLISTPIVTPASQTINIPAHLDSNLLLTLSKSLSVSNLGLNNLNIVNTTLQDSKRQSGIELLSLLATQQLMVSHQPNETTPNINCISMPQNCNHVIPINLTQIPQTCITQISQLPSSNVTQSRVITTSPIPSSSHIKPKLSTEDYVRKHIEAAERAVRADYMRKDNSIYKKPVTKQKVKIDPFPLTQKPLQQINNVKSTININSVSTDLNRGLVSQPPLFNERHGEDLSTINSNCYLMPPHLANGKIEAIPTITPVVSCDTIHSVPNMTLYNRVSIHKGSQNISVNNIVLKNLPSNFSCDTNRHLPIINKFDSVTNSKISMRNRNKSLRHALQLLRSEIRSLKFHMRADHNRLRRLEKSMHHLRNQIGK